MLSFGKYNTLLLLPIRRGEDSSQGGEDSPLPPPLENTLRPSFHQDFEETKGYSPGFYFQGAKHLKFLIYCTFEWETKSEE